MVLLGGVMALLGTLGCTQQEPPRDRIGALPYPGPFTLHHTVDASDLGHHRYSRWPRLLGDERERGILYTTRAGFLDLAHIRIAIDWVRYNAIELRRRLENGDDYFTVTDADGSVFHVTIRYPSDWKSLPDRERNEMIGELALRGGQRLTYLMLTWHEIITWFGYNTVLLVSEERSAFSYEDTMSHIVGMRVAERAMAGRTVTFDDAVTAALVEELTDLGVVSSAQADEAARAVEGVWWAPPGTPLKRHIDVGLDRGMVYPWLVRGLSFGGEPRAEPFPLPRLDNIRGRDLSGSLRVQVSPGTVASLFLKQRLSDTPTAYRDDRDVPRLMDLVRKEMTRDFGPAVADPWPVTTPVSTSRPERSRSLSESTAIDSVGRQ